MDEIGIDPEVNPIPLILFTPLWLTFYSYKLTYRIGYNNKKCDVCDCSVNNNIKSQQKAGLNCRYNNGNDFQ